MSTRDERRKTTDDGRKTAPQKACLFNEKAVVTFADSAGGDGPGTFTIVGYSGGIIANHWYWGNLAFDLEGTKFAKNPTPILAEHWTSERLGFTTEQKIEDNVTVEGKFLANERAKEMAADIKAGFPMEASLYISPSVVEKVSDGESVKVNGLTLKGPGTVFRKAQIKEVSMVVFGADSNTKSLAASAGGENEIEFSFVNKESSIMAEQDKRTSLALEGLTVEKFAAACPELCEEIRVAAQAMGVEAARARFADLKEVCGGDLELLTQAFADGKDVTETLKLRNARLEAANAELAGKVQAGAKAMTADELAAAEFSDSEDAQQAAKTAAGKGDSEEALRAKFAASAEFQTEFGGDVEAYLAYVKADKEGKVRTAGRG